MCMNANHISNSTHSVQYTFCMYLHNCFSFTETWQHPHVFDPSFRNCMSTVVLTASVRHCHSQSRLGPWTREHTFNTLSPKRSLYSQLSERSSRVTDRQSCDAESRSESGGRQSAASSWFPDRDTRSSSVLDVSLDDSLRQSVLKHWRFPSPPLERERWTSTEGS